jgi:hypothetical protein
MLIPFTLAELYTRHSVCVDVDVKNGLRQRSLRLLLMTTVNISIVLASEQEEEEEGDCVCFSRALFISLFIFLGICFEHLMKAVPGRRERKGEE